MTRRSVLALALLGLLLSLHFTGLLSRLLAASGGDWLASRPDILLQRSITRAGELLGPVALARGGADVLEGSTAVVEWGDLAQPVLDYLTLAWKALLGALVTLTALRAVWQAVSAGADGLLVAALACALLASVPAGARWPALARAAGALRRLGALLLRGWVLLWLALPLAWWGAGRAVERVQAPLRAQATASFTRAGAVFALDSVLQADGWFDRSEAVQEKMRALGHYLQSGGLGELGLAVVAITVVHLLEGLLLPLAMIWLVWLVLRGGPGKTKNPVQRRLNGAGDPG